MNIPQFNMENLKMKAAKFFSGLSKVAIVAIALFLGAIGRDIFVKVTAEPESMSDQFVFQEPKTISKTSIAVNERGELMIIDRTAGTYQLYQDSVGQVIFNMYAARIYADRK